MEARRGEREEGISVDKGGLDGREGRRREKGKAGEEEAGSDVQ